MIHPKDMSNDELLSAISQLQSEVAMPGPSPHDELAKYQVEAERRDLNW